jgi:hypothetical protein
VPQVKALILVLYTDVKFTFLGVLFYCGSDTDSNIIVIMFICALAVIQIYCSISYTNVVQILGILY